MPARRILDDPEHHDILEAVRDVVATQLAPLVDRAESDGIFPAEAYRILGEVGVLGMAYPGNLGGLGLPSELHLQILEEIGTVWASVAVGVSVHALSCFALANYGTPEQQQRWLPEMLSGTQVGAYSLSEPQAGSDPAATAATARRDGDEYVLNGTKAWVTNAGYADFYTVMLRTGGAPGDRRGISCFLVPADTPGLTVDPPEQKMGLTGSPTASLVFEDARIPADRLIGTEGEGLAIALAALDSGRLGISACATGLAQGALDAAVGYAKVRETFDRPIIDHQGVAFLLADMEAAVSSSRATYLAAARIRDRGEPFSKEASVAKLVATDNAMRVTTDAVQVLGGAGYTRDFPVERYMREAKVMQIFEGTNQIQRMVISSHLARDPRL
ncbi:Acyl-CoA dehydrogenase [Corynebacterium glyciniphilum AJ 3170]|uniref:Acyl-CoA dehydrogenase n=1 Tax=Corynebacterium glyciniphilum AJ 3170 TaxID=1404245 RepID=X5DVM7_9CORY|nr:acyl-CoA dehydrogenase family protein [Corynebacterium glyciniphilum]AHW64707.1 Acyl-CoA dehydrogenase [Corynebacterium glyciniphilum AJ 3170]